MSELKDIHRKALDLAKQANEALEQGDKDAYLKYTEEAYGLESKAAEMMYSARESEPTRSVLYRSAATLAFNCGKLHEAKNLIYAGLSGTPYPEIRIELEQLLGNVVDQIEAKSTPDQVAERIYLSILRDKAVNLKLESKTIKFSKAIFTEHIVDFLKTINTSYANFSKVNFRKAFTSNTEDTERMLDSFLKQSKPLCVDLGFNSFGVSIVADNETMFNSDFYSPAFNVWKDNVFTDYKEDVILPDYNSAEFLEGIKQKYTDEERKLIYAPILDKMKETTPFKFSVTENNFKKVIKPYKQPEKNSVEILNPPPTQQPSEPVTRVVTRSIDLVPSSGKGRKKNLDFSMVDSIDWKNSFKDFESKGRIINLKDNYLVRIQYNTGTFTIDDTYLNVYSSSNDYETVIDQFEAKVVESYGKLLETETPNQEEQVVLERFTEMVAMRNW